MAEEEKDENPEPEKPKGPVVVQDEQDITLSDD